MSSTNSSFYRFYETWFQQLNNLVQQLRTAPKAPATQDDVTNLTNLVHKVLNHYNEYHSVKSAAVERDVLSVFSAPWASSLERSLHWIAGWRPTTLFHLVYTESGILFESHIVDILRGLRTGDLGDLSPSQLRRVSELQCETVTEENAITDKLSAWQESASELVGPCTDFGEKIGRLVSIVREADDLRLRTVRNVVELLTPQQAVEFLVAGVELQFGIRGLGRNQDRLRNVG